MLFKPTTNITSESKTSIEVTTVKEEAGSNKYVEK